MIFADKLTTLRKKAGWSQEELAEKMGVTRQSVSKWEGAQSVPDIDKILQLSRLFDVTTDYLLKEELENQEPAADSTAFSRSAVPLTQPDRQTLRALTAAYWLVTAAIFLYYTFGPQGNGQPQYSWFIPAIAGVVYAALWILLKALPHKK